jgi:peroxiredoxin Q/BCP
MLEVGATAPDFTATLADGRTVRLRDLRGKRHVVLYFFPKAFTPGCTRETRGFCASYEDLTELGAEVIGVSLDSPEKQAEFAKSEHVEFPMIGDPDKGIGRAYDVLRLGGWLLAKRVTFVIDKQGVIRNVIHAELDVNHHIKSARQTLRELAG